MWHQLSEPSSTARAAEPSKQQQQQQQNVMADDGQIDPNDPVDEDSHPREWILFTKIDLDGDRKLQRNEVESYFKKQGLDNVAQTLMEEMDGDGDGEIDFAEFVSGYAAAG